MRRHLVAGLFLILLISLLSVSIDKAAAPPTCYGFTCGLISALDTNIRLSSATINAEIIPDFDDGENLSHSIEISSYYNITNIADHEVSFSTSYVRSSWTPENTYSSVPKNITIEGNSSTYSALVVYNISTQAELPEGISARYSSDFFSSFIDSRIDVINLTIDAHAEIVLMAKTIISARCVGHSFDVRYGLDMEQLRTDFTHLNGRFDVSNTSLLIRTDFLNSQTLSVDYVDDSLVATWSMSDWNWESEAPYPGLQMDEDVFTEYIGIQLWQSEYLLPTIGHGLPGAGIQLFFVIPVVTLLALLVAWRRLVK